MTARDSWQRSAGAARRRRALLGLAHRAAAQLGLDEDARRAAQAAFTGHASCAQMSDAQLLAWCWELKRRGAGIGIPGPRPDPARYGRPTAAQWARIERLALALGWADGLEAAALRSFVRRSFGVDDPRFLTNRQASRLIVALGRWLDGRAPVAATELGR